MTPVFADSFYYIALLSERDAAHGMALRVTELLIAPVVTTQFVLLEVLDACAEPPMRQRALALFDSIAGRKDIVVEPLSRTLWRDALARYRQRGDKGWSFTDCTSFIVMERRGLRETLTADHHFAQAGFKILMR